MMRRRISTSAFETKFDYIVSGAGTSGSVVAARLAANPSVRVLLLEAGGSDETDAIMNPNHWPMTLGPELDWGFVAEPNPRLNGRAIPYSMGVLGGGSSINVSTWSRGHQADWDFYAAQQRIGDPCHHCGRHLQRLVDANEYHWRHPRFRDHDAFDLSLGNIRALGVRSVDAAYKCGGQSSVDMSAQPDDVFVPHLRLRATIPVPITGSNAHSTICCGNDWGRIKLMTGDICVANLDLSLLRAACANRSMTVFYHLNGFPPDNIDWARLVPLIGQANAALARYDGLVTVDRLTF
jgi:choline dehydrogenase-like flavoprotein